MITYLERKNGSKALSPIGSEIECSFDFPNIRIYIDIKEVVMHHGKRDDGRGIWFEKVDKRNKEFMRKCILDCL